MLALIAQVLLGVGLVIGAEIETLENPKSICPKYWSDATHVNMGCILYNATTSMTWSDAQNFCHSQNSHLVEIFSQEQQDYAVMKAFESELLTGTVSNAKIQFLKVKIH